MRGRGINYDTGARLAGGHTREVFDAAAVRRDMRVIAGELHCTAVRVTGSDPGRLAVAAGHAAEAGLEVWFAPFPCDLTTAEMLPLFAACADRAEELRRAGAAVVFVAGGELSVFSRGFLPGDDLFARTAALTSPNSDLRRLLGTVPDRLNAFLAEVAGTVRARFGGELTYAALPFEHVDWTRFDRVAVDAYRGASNAATFREEIRALHRHGLPVAVTEFGCCTYAGAGDRGGRGWMIVDRTRTPWRLDGDYRRDEREQARHLRDLLRIFDEEGVDSAFWFTFANYRFPHHPDPRHDLDLASYGLVRLEPDMTWRPKAAYHALAETYGAMARAQRPGTGVV